MRRRSESDHFAKVMTFVITIIGRSESKSLGGCESIGNVLRGSIVSTILAASAHVRLLR